MRRAPAGLAVMRWRGPGAIACGRDDARGRVDLILAGECGKARLQVPGATLFLLRGPTARHRLSAHDPTMLPGRFRDHPPDVPARPGESAASPVPPVPCLKETRK